MDNLPTRKSIRLKNYDYSQNGAYYITICTKNKQHLFWNDIVGARIARPPLSDIGKVTENAINKISFHYPMVLVDKYAIMPNHIHMILIISNEDSERALRAPTISTIINQMKGYITKQIGYSIWQKLYNDHVIRSETEYKTKWEYIDTNPIRWQEDDYYV